jgi:hypothetical protein
MDNSQLVMLAIVLAAGWGLLCGIYERMILAPRRQLSAIAPAYFPAMTFALAAGCASVTRRETIFFAPLMVAGFFLVGAVPAVGLFLASRWVLRTRFERNQKG